MIFSASSEDTLARSSLTCRINTLIAVWISLCPSAPERMFLIESMIPDASVCALLRCTKKDVLTSSGPERIVSSRDAAASALTEFILSGIEFSENHFVACSSTVVDDVSAIKFAAHTTFPMDA